jgi:hypothetical protein
LSVVFNGCKKTWSLTLREHRLTAFKNRLLRRIFEHKEEEVAVDEKNCLMRFLITSVLFIK